MVFSTNQARQLYVVKANQASTLSAKGDIKVVKQDGCIYFEYLGEGGLVRSDLIPIETISYAKATKASALATKLPAVSVKLNSAVNAGAPVAGEHYILKVNYSQFVGISDEDKYTEMGEVLAGTGMAASDFYLALATNLAKNTAKQGMVTVTLVETAAGGTETEVLVGPNGPATALTSGSSYTEILIDAADPSANWVLGKVAAEPAQFTVNASAIVAGGLTVEPFTIAVDTPSTLANGKKIADLEYFCMGERADVYRGAGWPANIETKYMVDPTHAYHVIDIHYAYQGTCEDIQKSEKDIELVIDGGTAGTTYTAVNAVSSAINTATGFASTDPRYLATLS